MREHREALERAASLTAEEAKLRRAEVATEADFYGSMDGASKFVKGDAVAGILILVVNIVGLAITALLTWQFGALGVAFGMAGTVITIALIGLMICRRKIGIDPSILGLFGSQRAGSREAAVGNAS